MSVKLEIEDVIMNIVSGYAIQGGCEIEEREVFWREIDEVVKNILGEERGLIGPDFRGHVGEGSCSDGLVWCQGTQKDRWKWILSEECKWESYFQ